MAWASGAWGTWNTAMQNNYELTGTKKSKVNLSQEGMNKIIYDILSSDQGLAALATGEGQSGGFGSTTKALLAQDLVVKIAGELGKLTAETVQTGDETKTTKEGRALSKIGDFGDKYNFFNDSSGGVDSATDNTVICTELMRQGLLDEDLYYHPAARIHFLELPEETVRGYHLWAKPCVQPLSRSRWLSNLILPIVRSRYQMITTGKFKFLGAVTIYIGQPICYAIGAILRDLENLNGRTTVRT